jgi:hypothetical protein
MPELHARNESTNRSHLVKKYFGDVKNKSFLDFGGNRGNILYFCPDIDKSKYTCIDIDQKALDAGKEEFKSGNWIHYNKYNYAYNIKGNRNEDLPDVPIHNLTFAYSVISHTTVEDMIEILKWMIMHTDEKIVVSYLDIDIVNLRKYFYRARVKKYNSCVDFVNINTENIDYAYLLDNDNFIVNGTDVKFPEGEGLFATFYKRNYLLKKLLENGLKAQIEISDIDIPFIIIDV